MQRIDKAEGFRIFPTRAQAFAAALTAESNDDTFTFAYKVVEIGYAEGVNISDRFVVEVIDAETREKLGLL
jgi:nicotinic acid phosphoribosyltransferase